MNKLKQKIIKELHAFNQLDNKIVEAFGAKEYCSENGITYNIIEDNPVPSIDDLIKKYIDYRDSDIMEGVECGNVLAFLYFLKYNNLHSKRFILQKECKERLKELQNGVETK